MKLCSICDKKIEGTWCKNCHRFVKTYNISEGIHFNESHNPRNDANCTYHTGGNAQRSTARTGSTGTTATRQTYTQTTTRTQTTAGTQSTAGTKSTGNGKKKGKGKLAVILIVLYVIFNLIGALVPTITNCVGAISEEFKEGFNEEHEADDPFAETPAQKDSEEEENEGPAYEEKLAALEKLVPTDEYAEDDYTFLYYDPRDVVNLGFACDEAHYDMKVPEFEEWLSENWLDSYEIEEGISEYQNYLYEDGIGTWISFSLYRDYYAGDDFAIRVGYDTATQQLHMLSFVAMEDVDETALYYSALKKFDPDTDWTQKFFKENLKKALEESEYAKVYTSDAITIDAQVYEGYYSITFYPATYEY